MPTRHATLHSFVLAISLLILSVFSPLQAAADGETILTVNSPAEEPLTFSLEALDELKQIVISTTNEFVTGETKFSGPLARDLIENVGGDPSSTIVLTAINDYQISVPASDFFSYDVVLATRMNGSLLSRRDKGPIWLMYPISDHTELQDSTVNSKLIWQLVKMEVN